MSLPKYGEYKPSEIEWLQEVPAHWEVKRLIHVASCNDEVLTESTASDYEIEYIEISGVESGQGIIETASLRFGDAPSRARRIIRDGDILISTVRTYLRAIAQVTNPAKNMIASTGFAVIRPRHVESRYLGYACQTEGFVSDVIARSTGVSYPAINASELVRLHIPLPLTEEQIAIASFLDRETAKIDALIAEQEKLIALLAEKRQATISHAVTKGLNPNAPMKDSGVAWLGEVPEHWALMRVKDCGCEIIDCKNRTPELHLDGEYFVVRTSCVKDGKFNPEPGYYTNQDNFLEWTAKGVPQAGDVLFTREAPTGEACLAPENIDFCLGQRMMYIRPAMEKLTSKFLLYSIYGGLARERINEKSKGSTVGHLRVGEVGELPLLVPPLSEQNALVDFLESELAKLENLRIQAESGIALLKERRSALITAAVTGQIDVRNLPQEIPA